MKLYATTTSERGKPVSKSGNEAIRIQLTKDRANKFEIIFDGDKIEIMSYWDAGIKTIEYAPFKENGLG
jgi:hypothetical protein